MAILSLWIHSCETQLTAENCELLLQAIAQAAKAPVNFQIHKKPSIKAGVTKLPSCKSRASGYRKSSGLD